MQLPNVLTRLLALPYLHIATLLFSTIVFANPTLRETTSCGLHPSTLDSYQQTQLVTYTPSNPGGPYDGRLVYLPVLFGIPENVLITPLVIYPGTVPVETNVLEASLKSKQLLYRFSNVPAKVATVPGRKGLLEVYFRNNALNGNPVDTTGAFHVLQGCNTNGVNRDELWPVLGNFCVTAGATEIKLHIKTDEYEERENIPCFN